MIKHRFEVINKYSGEIRTFEILPEAINNTDHAIVISGRIYFWKADCTIRDLGEIIPITPIPESAIKRSKIKSKRTIEKKIEN